MPYTRSFDAEARRFETRFSGAVPVEEIIRNYMEMIHSPEWGPDVVRLIIVESGADLSELTIDVFQTKFVKLLADTAEIAGPPNKNAWVIQSDTTVPIAETWALMPRASELDVFGVFRTRAEALAWLKR